jgi:Disulphide bond corrector protein DsbC
MKEMFAATAVLLLTLLPLTASAQAVDPAAAETVSWTATVDLAGPVKPSGLLTVTLHAKVRDDWHVYGLEQLPNGPTPLRIAVDQNKVASAGGAVKGSPTTKVHDPAFNLDTPLYSQAFTVNVPVRVTAHPAPGAQSIPISVRFQTCNGAICQPPKTVHLSAPVTVAATG